MAIYNTAISIINIEGFEFDNNNEYNLLRTRNARGRPKKKRKNRDIYKIIKKLRNNELGIGEGELIIRPNNRYKIYSESGHNAQTCRQSY
jgi:uncharacterized protein (DUF1015 family)